MNVAIIAWGSVVWNPRSLPYRGQWQPDGPTLSLEFSRVSRDGRLTLVVDGENGVEVPTRFAVSTRRVLHDAIADLRDREGTVWKRVGFIDLKEVADSSGTFDQPGKTLQCVRHWSERQGFDAAIWTALPPSFKEETGEDFSIEKAMAYLERLPKSARKVALDYFQKAPREVETPLRNQLADLGWIPGKEEWGVK